MEAPLPLLVTYQRVREHLLAEREPRVHRELWSCNNVPYLVLRNHLSTLRSSSSNLGSGVVKPRTPSGSALGSTVPKPPPQSAQSKYTFEGVRHIFDKSEAPISVVSFAKVRSDLLAIGSAEGDLWLVELPTSGEAITRKAQKIHARAVTGLDWSFDNSQLLTCGEDGALCMWDAGDATCIRSMSLRVPLFCCRFHPLNPALGLVGTATGFVEAFNCSAGTLQARYPLPVKFGAQRQQVTAVEVSNHHVFLGDSAGNLHMYHYEMQNGQMARLVWHMKLHVAAASNADVLVIQYIPFCRTTGTQVLLVACADSSLSLLRIVGTAQKSKVELHSRVLAPPAARKLFPSICPLTCIQDLPLVTVGGEDTNVYICDISARHVDKPGVVMTLKGHSAPVTVVSWAFDESLLATGDCDGCCIIWTRAG